MASAQDPTFTSDLLNQYKEICFDQLNFNKFTEIFAVKGVKEWARKISTRVKCISDAISDAIKNTNYQEEWEEYKKNVEKLRNHLKACKNEPTTTEVSK